jgi:hypothetical protein
VRERGGREREKREGEREEGGREGGRERERERREGERERREGEREEGGREGASPLVLQRWESIAILFSNFSLIIISLMSISLIINRYTSIPATLTCNNANNTQRV